MFYEQLPLPGRSIRALAALAGLIAGSPLSKGLFAWTSMHDLCVVQRPVTYPYDGPYLRLSPVTDDQIEFRYLDTGVQAKQWHRTVDADEVQARLLEFLDELRWFPAGTLGR